MQNKSDNKILFENFIALLLTQVIVYVIPLVSLPYLSRVLGAEKFGLVFWADSLIKYFFIFTDFGFCLSAVREVSIYRDDKSKINQIFSSVMFIKFVLILISYVILLLCVSFIPKIQNEWLLFNLSFLMVIGNAIYPIWFFQGIEHMKYVTFLKIVSQGLFLILIFIFVRKPTDYISVSMLNALGFTISGLLGLLLAYKRFGLKLVIPKKEEIIHQFKYSSEFFLSRVAGTGYTNTNAFVIGLVTNPIMVAYYSAAEKIYQAMFCLSAPIGQVLYPYIAKRRDIIKYKKLFYPTLVFLVFMSLFMFVFAKPIISIFYGAEMVGATGILRIFCITILFSFISGLIGYPLLAAMGYSKEANYSVITASIFHIIGVLILFFINKISIYNIAIMTIFTELVCVSYRIYGIKKYKLWTTSKGE